MRDKKLFKMFNFCVFVLMLVFLVISLCFFMIVSFL